MGRQVIKTGALETQNHPFTMLTRGTIVLSVAAIAYGLPSTVPLQLSEVRAQMAMD